MVDNKVVEDKVVENKKVGRIGDGKKMELLYKELYNNVNVGSEKSGIVGKVREIRDKLFEEMKLNELEESKVRGVIKSVLKSEGWNDNDMNWSSISYGLYSGKGCKYEKVEKNGVKMIRLKK